MEKLYVLQRESVTFGISYLHSDGTFGTKSLAYAMPSAIAELVVDMLRSYRYTFKLVEVSNKIDDVEQDLEQRYDDELHYYNDVSDTQTKGEIFQDKLDMFRHEY